MSYIASPLTNLFQIIPQEVFMSSFFLFNWRILWTYWWQRHV